MGVSKTEKFTIRQNDIAIAAKALSHPARIAILDFLAKSENCICGDIVDEIGLAQATISQHLKELKKAKFIKGTIEGTKTCYCIDYDNLENIKFLLNQFLTIETNSCSSPINCC